MAHGTLSNLGKSSFVRTPPQLATRIVRALLVFPEGEGCSILDPTAGEGDLLFPCWDIPAARLFGVEISAERASVARRKLPPSANIVTSAFEGVHIPQGSMSLILANPPYFFQDGKRAEYRILAEAGELLLPGGILAAILPARSAWDGTMVNHWCKWYDAVRVWKFPDRSSEDDESAFEDFTQICVVGRRLATPRVPEAAQKKRLQGYRWRKPEKPGQSGWEQGLPPPELPTAPIADRYQVPPTRVVPSIVVRNADEATLLYALASSGAHLSPQWQVATVWPEDGLLSSSAMPYTGEAHVAAEFLTGVLDGEIVAGPGSGAAEARQFLFTTFVGQEWVSKVIDSEEREKLRERGVVHVSMRQTQDKPILGVLDLARGISRYYQGDDVFAFLQPWLQTLAARVVERRVPLYQLNPEEWELRVVAQFGSDKQLPGAPFPGLAAAQMHRVFALCRCIDIKRRAAIQGEPGTGKTRLAGATAARMAYRWRQRNAEFRHAVQPAWVAGLRRAWLHNPATLQLLGLEPVTDAITRQVVAYRASATGQVIAPEEAGPRALPVLVTTPKKVTREYAQEIRAAWPEAEVLFIKTHSDIPLWLQRCASSAAPAVLGVFSHSTTRAFGREWQPAVLERTSTSVVPDLAPEKELQPLLEAVRDARERLVGYRFKESDSADLLTKEVTLSYFYCPDCSVSRRYPPGGQVGRVDAVPGQREQPEERPRGRQERQDTALAAAEEQDKEKERRSEPVTSRGWFRQKPRWCNCPSDRRNEERRSVGKPPVRAPLWNDMRTEATQRKNPQLAFAAWSRALSALVARARHAEQHATVAELVQVAQGDEAVLARLLEGALCERDALTPLVGELVRCGESALGNAFAALQREEAALAQVLVGAFKRTDPALADLLAATEQRGEQALGKLLLEVAQRDTRTLASLLDGTRCDAAALTSSCEAVQGLEAALASQLRESLRRHPPALPLLIAASRSRTPWFPLHFRRAFEEAHAPAPEQRGATSPAASRAGKRGNRPLPRGVRLAAAEGGPIAVVEADLAAAQSYEPVRNEHGAIVAYRLLGGEPALTPVYGNWSGRIVGYRSAQSGQLVTRTCCYDFRMPPPDSFNPYQYLYQFYGGCVALAVVDESHNGRGRDTDIARAHHFAMLAAQAQLLTSGTHYGGDILGFYHYWFRFNPQFWLQRGYGWNDAEKALSHYGVVQEWTKEYESEARRGSGQTNVQVSTIPAPGLSAKLIPRLLEDLSYLTVLDVGAYMPPRIEIPEIVSMRDAEVEDALERAEHALQQAEQALAAVRKNRQRALHAGGPDDAARRQELADFDGEERAATLRLAEVRAQAEEAQEWALARNLSHHYLRLVKRLDELARERNNAARMAKGTVPRWFAALPCQSPFEVWQSERSDWGDTLGKRLLVRTPVLEWNHLYPLEKRLVSIVERERGEGRRVMVYFEQNDVRSMARRLEWILKEFHPWTLPNSVEAEERQQAICDAVDEGHAVLIVPYRRVNEGLNLQHAVDTIVWYEMALNLFMLDQASRRAWRLGKREEVRIYYLVYAGTAGHAKLRKLGGQSGAAAAFAGEPARGALIEHAGADQTTLARLSACLEETELADEAGEEEESCDTLLLTEADDSAALKAAFAQRGAELREALKRGRQWFGAVDTLPERLAELMATQSASVWTIAAGASREMDRAVRIVESVPAPQATTPGEEHSHPTPPEAAAAAASEYAPVAAQPVASEAAAAPVALPQQDGEETAAVTPSHDRVGTPLLVFGLAEHIQLVRRRRTLPASSPTKPRAGNRTEVRYIPSLNEAGEAPASVPPAVVLLSLWDHLASLSQEEGELVEGVNTRPVPTTAIQSMSLWAD
jgi:predicted RNA methylase